MDMTEKQIEQNALKAEKEHGNFNYQYQGEAFNKGYLAGAHSRDEEVEQLRKAISSAQQAMTELAEIARNPWISVENRLPEKNCVVFVSLGGTEYLSAHYRAKSKRFVTISKDKQTLVEVRKSAATYTVCGDCIKEERLYSEGQREDITSLVTHWMPIPELKKGE